MSKRIIIFLLFVLSLLDFIPGNAQSPCATVSVQAFAMNPQTGAYNYFGVRVTLTETYYQDITVEGTIVGDGGAPSQPFSITVTAGTLTNETDATFFQTDPTSGAEATITSISHCPGPVGGERLCGSEFISFNLQGQTLEYVINYIGTKHNEYQENIYQKILEDTTVLTNGNLQLFLQQKTISFMGTLGITAANNPLPANFDVLDTAFIIGSTLSSQATGILNEVANVRNSISDQNFSLMIAELENLKQEALNLDSFNEALAVSSTISVAINSYQYWNENLSKWLILLHVASDPLTAKAAPCGIAPKKIAGADIGGAYAGATGGVIAGPGGAFAGAVIGGAVSSTGAVLWEASKCIPYVGSVIRWLDDWF